MVALVEERTTLSLHPHQMEAWDPAEPFVALVTGLGGGKTFAGSRWIVARAIAFPGSLHLATGNSYRQLEDVVIPELLAACDQLGVPYTWQKGALNLTLHLGERDAVIRVRSTNKDSVDKLRGAEYGSWWADEARDMTGYAADVVFGRLRCNHVDAVRCLWTTTPNGFDHIYERFVDKPEEARQAGKPVNYKLVQAPSDANTSLRSDYLDTILASYDVQMAEQERHGKFVAMGKGQVYRAFDRRRHVAPLPFAAERPVILCVDFNIDPMAWVLCQQVSGGKVNVVAEVFCRNSGINETVAVLASRFGKHQGGWEVYGDATGHARNNANKTDYAMLRAAFDAHGIKGAVFRVPKSNPPVKDRVNAVNAMLCNAKGQGRLLVDRGCANLIKGLEQVVWDDSGHAIKKEAGEMKTHAPDALGYYLWAEHRPEVFRRGRVPGGLL